MLTQILILLVLINPVVYIIPFSSLLNLKHFNFNQRHKIHTSMKTPITFLLSLLIVSMSHERASAQNTFPVLSMQVDCTPTSNYLTVDSIIHFDSTTVFNVQMQIVVDDTTNISSIEIQFGKSESEILRQKTFTFDVSGSLGDGTNYSRNGYNILLDLGSFTDVPLFYSEMSVTRTNNSHSSVFTYHQ